MFERLFGDRRTDPALEGRVPPGQYVTEKFPVLHYGSVPRVDLATWDFKVYGEVDNPFRFTWAEFKALPRKQVTTDIHCVTRWSKLDTHWEGVAIQTILELAQVRPGATYVVGHAEQGYTANLPLAVLDDDDVLLADTFEGEPLEPDHGYPLRLIVPKRYFWKGPKWIRGLEFLTTTGSGFWERYGYNNDADPWQEAALRRVAGDSEVERRPDPLRLGGAQDEHRGGRVLDRDAHGLVERELVGVLRPVAVPATSSPISARAWSGPMIPSSTARASSTEPVGGGANAAARDSTTSTASRIVSPSTSPSPAVFQPTDVTWVPGRSQARRTTGAAAWVAQHTISATAQASSTEVTASTATRRPGGSAAGPSPANSSRTRAASASATSARRPTSRIRSTRRSRASARACAWAWAPVPTIATTCASSRARSLADSAAPAAVRDSVITRPSITAIGVPLAGSKAQISAWCVGRSRFSGNRLTSFVVRAPADGR